MNSLITGVLVSSWALVLLLLLIPVLILIYVLVRGTLLSSRSGSFSALLYNPRSNRWVNGTAIYGQHNLVWRRNLGFRLGAEITLPRGHLKVTQTDGTWQAGQVVTLKLATDTSEHTLRLNMGDASGLIAWVDSAPPGPENTGG